MLVEEHAEMVVGLAHMGVNGLAKVGSHGCATVGVGDGRWDACGKVQVGCKTWGKETPHKHLYTHAQHTTPTYVCIHINSLSLTHTHTFNTTQ